MPHRLVILVTVALLAGPGAGCALVGGVSDPARDPALYSLSASLGALVPAFDPAITEYRLEVALSDAQVSLTAIAGADDATITIAGAAVADETPAALALSPGQQRVEVVVAIGDATRTYTIHVVRGLSTEAADSPLSTSLAGDRLGHALVMAGDTLAVGAPATMATVPVAGAPARGAVYAASAAPLTSSDALAPSVREDGDGLGMAVAVAGDLLVVGAPGSDVDAPGGEPVRDAGIAHVFVRSDGRWRHQASLAAAVPRAGARFGAAVAVMADPALIVVGAPGASGGPDLADAGAAHVFVTADGGWLEGQVLAVRNPGRGDGFGAAVAVSGDAVVVGAPGRASGASTAAGAVYRFASQDGRWVETRVLAPGTPVTGAAFGHALAVDGGVMVVGAPGDGAAYVYHGLEDAIPDARLTLDGAAAAFGASVAVDGDLVVVGAPGLENAARGAAAVYGRRDATWTLATTLAPRTARDGDRFGAAVAVSGLHIAVGAPGLAPAPGVAIFAGAVHRFE